MYAVVVNVTIDDPASAQASLDQAARQTASIPGFVAAYWVALSKNKGTSIAVFESEASAQALSTGITPEASAAMSVTLQSVEVGEVIGSA
jgi:hypothetical protein